jgi:hypothetical protein
VFEQQNSDQLDQAQDELRSDAELLLKAGTASTLRCATHSLDVSEKYLRRVAPDIADMLVANRKEEKRAKNIRRAKLRFEVF